MQNNKLSLISLIFLFLIIPIKCFSAWTTVGMGGGGAQYGPSISPLNSNLRFVGSDMSGWYRSADGGNTWNMLDFYQISTSVDYNFNNGLMCAMAFHPTNADIVYGFGPQQDTQNNPANLLVSNDGGQTWSVLINNPPWTSSATRITVIYLDRGNANFMLIGTDAGVFTSTNGGTSFTGPSGSSGYVTGIIVDQSSPVANRTCYAGTSAGVFKSTNEGTSWLAANTGLPSTSVLSFSGASTAAGPRLFEVDSSTNDIYTSTNAANWTLSSNSDAFSMIACADNDTATAYATNENDRSIWKTADGGNTWNEVLIDTNPTPNASMGWISYDLSYSWGAPNDGLCVNPSNSGQCMFANMGETFMSNDAGATWQEAYSVFSDTAPRAAGKKWTSCGLEMTSAWHYDIDPNNSNYHYICYTDIGFERSTDGGNTWYNTERKGTVSNSWTNTFYQIAFNPTPGTILAAVSGLHDLDHSNPIGKTGYSGGVAKSTDYGTTWVTSATGLPVSPTTSIVFDSVNNIYYCTVWGMGVYKSTDATGSSWIACATVAIGTNKDVYSLKLVNGTLFCLLSSQKGYANPGGLFKSTNQGASWTNIAISVDSSGNPLKYPTDFDVNTTNNNIIFICAQDGGGLSQGGCYKTVNQGTNWTQVTVPIGHTPYAFAPSIDPGNTNTVYFGTENQGFFESTDGGSTWVRVTDLPFSSIQRLYFAPSAIYACTFGGGVWMESTGPASTPTQTLQAPSFTPTATNTPSKTPTLTITATFTATTTPSYTTTPTITETITGTPPTMTNTPSATNTLTITLTNTPIDTFSTTNTFTSTNTITATNTITQTLTTTPVVSETITMTPVLGLSGATSIGNVKIWPNPYNTASGRLNIGFTLDGDIDELDFELYTSSFRLIRDITADSSDSAGQKTAAIDNSYFSSLASGSYYFVLIAKQAGKQIKSKAGMIIMLK